MSRIASLAYWTGDLPGVGGVLKQRPEDFLVEEQPLYDPVGEGEHLYLYVEKIGRTTSDVVRTLAKRFRVSRAAVGYAGLKDKHAVTRQHFSIHLTDRSAEREGLARLEGQPTLKVLWVDRHVNKIRRGHLAGNRFVIRLRDVRPTDVLAVKRVIDRLEHTGSPNYFGLQRFGYRENGDVIGRALLLGQWKAALDEMLGAGHEQDSPGLARGRELYRLGEYGAAMATWPRTLRFDRQALDALRQGATPEQAVAAIDAAQRALYVSAMQSAIYNRVLDQRVRAQTLNRLAPGDLAWKHDSRSVFAVDKDMADAENAPDGPPEGGVVRHEISPSGPLWGLRMPQAQGAVAETEATALVEAGLEEARLGGVGDIAAYGRRRSLRVFLRDADVSGGVDEHGSYVRLAFELPRGAFATMVLREVMK